MWHVEYLTGRLIDCLNWKTSERNVPLISVNGFEVLLTMGGFALKGKTLVFPFVKVLNANRPDRQTINVSNIILSLSYVTNKDILGLLDRSIKN